MFWKNSKLSQEDIAKKFNSIIQGTMLMVDGDIFEFNRAKFVKEVSDFVVGDTVSKLRGHLSAESEKELEAETKKVNEKINELADELDKHQKEKEVFRENSPVTNTLKSGLRNVLMVTLGAASALSGALTYLLQGSPNKELEQIYRHESTYGSLPSYSLARKPELEKEKEAGEQLVIGTAIATTVLGASAISLYMTKIDRRSKGQIDMEKIVKEFDKGLDSILSDSKDKSFVSSFKKRREEEKKKSAEGKER